MELLKKLWKDPVWSKVIATGIIALIVAVATYILNLWPDILSLIKLTWGFITSSTSTPNWLLTIMAIPCFLFVMAILPSLKGKKNQTSSFTDYVKDNFEGLSWGWRYHGQQITNLHCLCPKCQYQIIPRAEHDYQKGGFVYIYACEECGYKVSPVAIENHEFEQKIELKIQKKLRTGEWIEALNA
jgi:predicted RNA-binding Zn-ribbon protein involved in translation (DUF1610 family)